MSAVKKNLTSNSLFINLFISCIIIFLFVRDNNNYQYGGLKENLHIYLLIGQSNMSGRAEIGQEDDEVIAGCYLLNDNDEWEPAKNPLNRYSSIKKVSEVQKLNPGYTFAKNMDNNKHSISLGLIVNAKGATSINLWKKGSEFYNEALRRTKIAQKTGVLKGILWHQGEADAGDVKYLDKLKVLIADLRHDLAAPELPFVAGQVKKDLKQINDQIAALPLHVPSTGFVSSVGLTLTDSWHFDTVSMKLLGQRYSVAMQRIHALQDAEERTKMAN